MRLLLARPGLVTASVLSGDWAGGAAAQAEQLVSRVAGVEGSRDKWKLVTVYLGGESGTLPVVTLTSHFTRQ